MPSYLPLSLVLAALLASPAGAVDPKPAPPADAGLVERVTVQLVQLNFVAVDRKGNPVTDLRPDDLEVFEDGERQTVAFLQPYYSRDNVTDRPSEKVPPLLPPEPEPGTPVPAYEPVETGRWLVLFFDLYTASQRTRLESIEAARTFLGSELNRGDRVAVVAFDGKLHVLQLFTTDRGKLSGALSRAMGMTEKAAEDRQSAISTLVDEMDDCKTNGASTQSSCAQHIAEAYEDDRRREIDAFTKALDLLARSLAPIPETKAVVLFSEGFARNPAQDAMDVADAVFGPSGSRYLFARSGAEVRQKFDDLARSAAESKVSFFTINPGGASKLSAISAANRGLVGGTSNLLQVDVYRRAELNAQQSLSELASRTGGIATQGADVLRELRRVDSVSEALYTVGYYPTMKALLDDDRKIRIRIRRKGVRAEFRRDLPRAVTRAPLGGELTVEPGRCEDNGRRVLTVRLRVDRSSLTFERVRKNVSANFAIYVRLTEEGAAKPSFEDHRFFNVSNSGEEQASGNVVDPTFEQLLVAPCKPMTVEVTATDGGSGAERRFKADVGP